MSVLSDPTGADTERITLDRHPDGVIIASAVRDGAGAVADFWIEYANRTAIELIGTTENDLVGRRLLDLDHRYGLGHLRQLSHVVATARPYDGSFQRSADAPELGIHATKFADGVLARVRLPSGSFAPSGSARPTRSAVATGPTPPLAAPVVPSSGVVPAAVLEATQALLRVESEAEVADLVRHFECALPEPHLPAFLEHAHRVTSLLRRAEQLAEEASIDVLTGRAGQRALGRVLDHLGPGDAVVMIDLDHFRQLEDAMGKYEGDRVRRAFGRMLRDTAQSDARACRYGGEEFLVVVHAGNDAADLVSTMRAAWPDYRPHQITFSAGVAVAGADPSVALAAADRALFGAKRMGRDRTEWAVEEVQ